MPSHVGRAVRQRASTAGTYSSPKSGIPKSSFFTRGNIQHLLRQIFVCVGNLTFTVIGKNAFAFHIGFGNSHGGGDKGVKHIDFHSEILTH